MGGQNTSVGAAVYQAVSPTIYTPEVYPSYYDSGYCLNQNVTYSHRVDVPDNFNYCSTPLTGQDAFLFTSIALLVAAFCMGKLSAIWMLVAGGIAGLLNFELNLGRVSNAISLWLGIQPPDIFFYAFLPPLLTDAAMRLDFYIFKKIWPHIVLMAYVMVIINACILTPFILFAMDFSSRGWDWVHGAVLASIFAPTDAVSVTAILKAGGGPETMVVLMEGEALLNDASAVTMFAVFMGILEEHQGPGAAMPSVPSQIPTIITQILKLTGIGIGIGLGFGIAATYMLKLLRWRGAQPYVEATTTLTLAYLAFYVAQSPAQGSGVIAVVVFGLYGSATGRWGMLASDAASGVHMAVWDTLAFIANGLIFFWGGISAVNFVARAASSLGGNAWSYGAIPLLYLFMFATRALTLAAFNPLFRTLGTHLSLPQLAFTTVAALRGSLSLIMIADYTIKNDFYTGSPVDEVNFDVNLWTSCFVLLTLLINAPLIGPVMRWTGLSKITPEKVRLRRRAAEEVRRFTQQAVQRLRQGTEDGEFLQGANWEAVEHYVDLSAALDKFAPAKPQQAQSLGWRRWLSSSCCRGPCQQNTDEGPGSGAAASPKAAADASPVGADGLQPDGSSGGSGLQPGASTASQLLRREELDMSEDIDGPLLEVPYLQDSSSWNGKPLRKYSSAVDAFSEADPEAGLGAMPPRPPQQNGLKAAERRRSEGGCGSARRWRLPRVTFAGQDHPPGLEAQPAGPDASAASAPRLRALHRAFVSAPDVFALASAGRLLPPSAPAESSLGDEAGEDVGDVVLLYSKGDDDAQGGDKDFEARYFQAMPAPHLSSPPAVAAAGAAGSGASPAQPPSAGRPPPPPPGALNLHWAPGSDRDLLGRTQVGAREFSSPTVAPSLTERTKFSVALKEMRKETGLEAGGGRSRTALTRPASRAGGMGDSTPANLRARVVTGLQRYFQLKRLQGLLSTRGLRILHYAAEKAAEELEHAPLGPLRLWELVEREIRPTWATRGQARLLRLMVLSFKGAPACLRAALRWPLTNLAGLLRKNLGQSMLSACEVAVEVYLGLSTSPQVRWVYGEEAPLWLLEEVEGQLERAYAFIVDREAEAPHQYQAIQSYRAAMAVLQQQRAFLVELYQLGSLDEGEQEELLHQLDQRIRHLDIVGPVWRPPRTDSVLLGLPWMLGAPPHLVKLLRDAGSMQEYKPGEVVWGSSSAVAGGGGWGLGVVVAGVISRQWLPREGTSAPAQEWREGIGGLAGLLQALNVGANGTLPGQERVVAQGNSLGRGPLLFHLPQGVVDEVRAQARAGDAGAAEMEAALLRVAAAHLVEYLEADVTTAVHSFLALHHPLARKAGQDNTQQAALLERERREFMAQRVAKYTTQVLMDIMAGLPSAAVVRLAPGQSLLLSHHSVLLEGTLLQQQTSGGVRAVAAPRQQGQEVPAPAVLPRLAGQRRLFSFYARPVESLAGQQAGGTYMAGEHGAVLVVTHAASTSQQAEGSS